MSFGKLPPAIAVLIVPSVFHALPYAHILLFLEEFLPLEPVPAPCWFGQGLQSSPARAEGAVWMCLQGKWDLQKAQSWLWSSSRAQHCRKWGWQLLGDSAPVVTSSAVTESGTWWGLSGMRKNGMENVSMQGRCCGHCWHLWGGISTSMGNQGEQVATSHPLLAEIFVSALNPQINLAISPFLTGFSLFPVEMRRGRGRSECAKVRELSWILPEFSSATSSWIAFDGFFGVLGVGVLFVWVFLVGFLVFFPVFVFGILGGFFGWGVVCS